MESLLEKVIYEKNEDESLLEKIISEKNEDVPRLCSAQFSEGYI